MPRKPRTTPGLITMVGARLRIINGDVDSLRKLRKVGRPKQNIITDTVTQSFPGKRELSDQTVRDGFQYVRFGQRETRNAERSIALQHRYKLLADQHDVMKARFQEAKDRFEETKERLETSSQRHAVLVERYDNETLAWVSERRVPESRIERSVPISFCNCKVNSEPLDSVISCSVHGLKRSDCDCGGISGVTGFRSCAGHRQTGHTVGVKKDLTVLASANAKLREAA